MSYAISFLLIIALIAAFAVIFPRLTGRLNTKMNLFVVCGYLVLLVILSVACLLIPRGSLVRVDTAASTADGHYTADDSLFWHRLSSGNFSAPKGCVQTQKSFTPQGKTFSVKTVLSFGNVWVGKKGVNVPDNHSGKIDVYFYAKSPLAFVNYKYNPKIQPLSITYKGTSLSIKESGDRLFNISGVDDRMAAKQFYNGFSGADLFNQINISDYALIVVLLPKGVTVNGGDYNSFPTY
jgi:hypothetical protein